MSKSLARVTAALSAAGISAEPLETGDCRTAQAAADAVGCALDQIAKSILFAGAETGRLYLFLTAGGNQVDAAKASALAAEPLTRADARQVREVTGFAIGGVSPLGHLTPSRTWLDPRLLEFPVIWGAAGTPRHMFAVDPARLRDATGAIAADFTG